MNAEGNRNTTIYDPQGRPAASVNPLGNRWTTVFNSVGQTVGSKDPLGNRSTSVFDTAGRVFASINPLGKRTTTIYNIASQSLATVDANGNRVSSVYDPLGRRIVEINANDGRTTTIFNPVGQTSALVDARGNRHSFTYDSTGAQTQLIDPLNRRTTNAYDAAGQQNLRIDARGNRTTYAYSPVGQLANRKYPDGSRATFSYDTVGNRTLMADSTGRYTNVYDAVGQTTVTASPNNQRQTFSYDAVGQRRSMDATGAGRFTYSYDAANQISSLLNPYTERTTFAYDDAGRRNVQRNANGTRVSLSYDAASQTTQVFHRTSAGASVLQLDYGYDPAGNRKSMAENATAARMTWTYDKQNQLLGEYRTGTNPYRQTFTYDAAGNRTLKNVDTVRTTYAYDVANQLKYGQAVAGRTTFAYDATGNQRIEQPPTGNRTTTTWNYENQPTQYRLPTGSPVTMSYNGDNRRVISQQGATSTKFVWDTPTDAYLTELNAANAVQAVYTNEPRHYGSVVSQRRATTSRWLHADALGTTRALTSSTQTIPDTYLYDAWGNLITSSGTTVNPFRWVGKYGYYQDSATGLVYVRARMYQAATARWVSADPLGIQLESHLYKAVLNSPVEFDDPSGLAFRAKFVAKSFINRIPSVGTLPRWRRGNGLPIPTPVLLPCLFKLRLSPLDLRDPTARLRVLACLVGSLPAFNEDPLTDINDGIFRLYSMVDVKFCCDGGALKLLDFNYDKRGGNELPGVDGTINMTFPAMTRIDASRLRFSWTAWGKPNPLVEPGMEWVAIRTSVNIWHQPEVDVLCRNGEGFYEIRRFTESKFPSRRLWVNGGPPVRNIAQGAFSDLWQPMLFAPSFVAE